MPEAVLASGILADNSHRLHKGLKFKHVILYILLSVISTGCSLIDDDLSVCGQDITLTYYTRLNTNIEEEIARVLPEQEMQAVADDIRRFLAPVFQPDMHDLHLLFFDSVPEAMESKPLIVDETVNAPSVTYTRNLPRGSYSHLVVANSDGNGELRLGGESTAASLNLSQPNYDTIYSHPTGIYTARPSFDVTDSILPARAIPIYIMQSAVALVIETADIRPEALSVCLHEMASSFTVEDSTYHFSRRQVVRMDSIDAQCFAAVCLPSRDSADDGGAYYHLNANVTLPDGSVTQNILSLNKPLRAGQLKIIRVRLKADGAIEPDESQEVGVSVQLDWKEGGHHEVVTG